MAGKRGELDGSTAGNGMNGNGGRMEGLEVTTCQRCPALVETRSQIVNGVGPVDADLLIVGEAPGADEDRQGEPFVGRSGKLLDEKLATAGIDRASIRITNCIRCRPPDNRDPLGEELAHCNEWLLNEIDTVDPAVIMAVGKVPAEHLLQRSVAVTKEAGSIESVHLGEVPRTVIVSVHPAAMLYDPSQEENLESTLEVVARQLGISPPSDPQTGLGDFE